MNADPRDTTHHPAITPEQVEHILKLANSICYGSITLVIQNGILTQIEKNEKYAYIPNRS